VPLIYKNRVVGVLTLDKNEPNAFKDGDARYVFTLAYQIAIAVENAQLFEEWEEQATRLKLINEVAQEINTFLDVDELFVALAQAIYDRLAYDSVTIFQIDETRSLLTLKAVAGSYQPTVEVNRYQQDLQQGLIGQAIQSGRPLLINNLAEQADKRFIEGLAVRSVLIVPLAVGTQVEAVICVGRDVTGGFTDQDLWTLSSLGSQAAIAVKNAWLYRSLDAYSDTLERTIEARTQRLQAIRQISQLVSQGLSIDELLKVVHGGLVQIFTAAGVAEVEVTIGLRNGAKINLNRRLTIKIDPATLVGQVINQARSKLLSQVKRQNLYALPAGAADETIESLLMAPLIAGGKVIGLIMVESQTPELFDESDLETLDTLAFQIASAIEHARLLQKTREMAIVDERTRLARDMHDGIAQNLAYLLIQVDRALNMVEDGSKVAGQLEQISSLLKQNIDELRRHIFDLRPLDLEGKPIFEVLERFVTEFGQRWNLKTTCTIQSQAAEMSPEVERTLYRILQEALSNARQHAQCKQLTVNLVVVDQEWVSLEVCDDGLGFEVTQSGQRPDQRPGKGLGLTSMRERAQRVGGQLRVESGPDRGARVVAVLPLQESATTIKQVEGKNV
jgi:signal transduction histidine kinase